MSEHQLCSIRPTQESWLPLGSGYQGYQMSQKLGGIDGDEQLAELTFPIINPISQFKWKTKMQFIVQICFDFTWRRCRSKQCSIVCAWGEGSKHGNSAVEKDILWETPTTTPTFGRRPRGYTSRSNSSSGSNCRIIYSIYNKLLVSSS